MILSREIFTLANISAIMDLCAFANLPPLLEIFDANSSPRKAYLLKLTNINQLTSPVNKTIIQNIFSYLYSALNTFLIKFIKAFFYHWFNIVLLSLAKQVRFSKSKNILARFKNATHQIFFSLTCRRLSFSNCIYSDFQKNIINKRH